MTVVEAMLIRMLGAVVGGGRSQCGQGAEGCWTV